MEILKFFKKNLNHKDPHTQILISLSCSLIIIFHIIYFFTNDKTLDIIQIICQIILVLIILIWIFSSTKFFNCIKELEKLFKTKQYKNAYRKYINLIHQFNYKKWSIRRIFIELIYVFAWFFPFINAMVQLYHFGFVPSNFIGTITIILFAIAIYLNYFSSHLSFSFAFFIYQISKIEKLDYNRNLPSATWGFQILKYNISLCLFTYFIVSSLYTMFFIVIIFFTHRTRDMVILINNEILKYYAMLIVFILTSFTFFILLLLPNIFLYNLFSKWRHASLYYFEKKLLSIKKHENCQEKIWIIERIKDISNDRMRKNYIDLIIAITNIILNISAITSFIIEYI